MMLSGYTLREMTRNRARTVLTLVGVVIGVAALVAVGVTLDTTRGAYRQLLERVGGRAALAVLADGEGGLDPELAGAIGDLPGVRAAVASVQRPAALVMEGGPRPSLVIGIEPERDSAVRSLDIREGRPLGSAEEVLLDAEFAERHGFDVGSSVRLVASTGFADFTVAGTVESGGTASLGGAVTYMRLDAAQAFFGLVDRVSTIELVLEDVRERADVAASVRAKLPPGLRVEEPAARGALARDAVLSSEQGLEANSALSLIAGAFIVLNTFLMSVGERKRQLALLRALGATRRQITRLLLREALILSAVGTLVGIVVGLGGAHLLKAVMESLLGLRMPRLVIEPAILLLALVAGPGVAVLATLVPARRAGATAPLQLLMDHSRDAEEPPRRWPVVLGVFFLLLLAPLELGLVQGWLSGAWIAPGMVVLMVGAILLFPLLTRPLFRLSARLLAPFSRESGPIAFRQLARHRARTNLTAGVFFVAVTIAVGMGFSLRNSLRDIEQWYDRVLGWDHFVRAAMPDLAMLGPITLPDGLAEELAAVEGVERVARFAFITSRVNDRPALVVARSVAPGEPLHLDVEPEVEDAVRDALVRGHAVLGAHLARQLGVEVGDRIELASARGSVTVTVAALTTEYTVGGAALYLEWDRARDLWNISGPHALVLEEREGARDVGERLRAFCAERKLLHQSNADMMRDVSEMTDGVIGTTWLLVTLVFLVASLGAVNTLTMNVLEQTRELGLLRAIAMTRRQVGRLVRTQAFALGLLGLVPGLALGSFIGFLMHLAGRSLYGYDIAFHVHPSVLTGCAVLTIFVSYLAGMFPARRAMRLRIFDALRYE